MAHGLNTVIKSEIECNNKPRNIPPEMGSHQPQQQQRPQETPKMGSRRIFTPQFKLQVLESYRNDSDCKGNQRATARKYGIHRRQIQKWLQVEDNLRSVVANSANHHHSKMIFNNNNNNTNSEMKLPFDAARHRVVVGSGAGSGGAIIKNHVHSALTTTTRPTTTTKMGKQSSGAATFISPVHTYGGCDQPVSFAQSLYESSSPSTCLSTMPNTGALVVPTNTGLFYPDTKCGTNLHGHLHHLHSSPNYPRTIEASPTSGFTPYQPPSELPPLHLPPYVPIYHDYPPQYFATPTTTPTQIVPTALVPPPPPITPPPVVAAIELPIDLSLPSYRRVKSCLSRTPSPYDAKWVNNHHHLDEHVPIPTTTTSSPPPTVVTVDLRKRKHADTDDDDECDHDGDDTDEAISCSNSPPPNKPVKLFKPYLLDESQQQRHHHHPIKPTTTAKKNSDSPDDDVRHRQRDAIIWNNHQAACSFAEYSSVAPAAYLPVTTPPFEVPSPTTATGYWIPQASPVSGYDSSTSSIYSDSESTTQHFSIDFKVHPITDSQHHQARYVESWIKREHHQHHLMT